MVIDDKVVTWIIAGIGVFIALVTWLRTRRQDCRADGGMQVDITYIKRGVDDIRVSQQRLQDDLGRLSERVARVEESSKSAHHRLDEYIKLHPPD